MNVKKMLNQRYNWIYLGVILSILMLVPLTLCMYRSDDQSEVVDRITIALSQAEKNNPRLTEVINSFESASEAKGVEFIYHEPDEFTSEWQLQDVERLFVEGVDYLVLAPRESSIIKDVLIRANEYQIPVILLSSQVGEENIADVVSTINTDYVKEGMLCAKILAEKYDGDICRIIEVKGIEGSTIAMERAIGFRIEMAKHSNMLLVDSVQGDFNRLSAKKAMETVIVSRTGEFDAIFAHSDEDGIGALNAMKVAGYLEKYEVDIVSVNGVQDVLKAIVAEEYLATVHSNAKLGEVVFDIIGQMERDFVPSKKVVMPYAIIDESNAEAYLQLTY